MRWITLLIFLTPGFVLANDWDALSKPGAIAIMRHALAPGTGDPANLTVGDCSTQRNLDEQGRAQARSIGSALRDRGIELTSSSVANGAERKETAELLGLGPVVEAPPLNSFFRDFSTREAQTKATRELIAETEGRLMLVTHQVNISALTGKSTRSGEILVLRIGAATVEVLGRILIDP